MRARMLTAAAAWLVSAAAAMAQPAFPTSLEREPLLEWLRRETDITPERLVAVTPQAVTAIVSSFPGGGGQGPRVVIRAEALSADTYARTGVLSWHVSLNADCQGHRVKLGETTGYPERNLLGARQMMRPADSNWRPPEPGTALDNAWRAACEPDFRGPFQQDGLEVSKPDKSVSPVGATAAPPLPAVAATPDVATRSSARSVVVQVGAALSEAEARALLDALASQAAGRDSWVETAQVAGRTWRRAVIGGFADAREAGRFCAQLKAAGRACFVRAAPPD